MEGQISFEFLIYLGIMTAGMVAAIALFAVSYPSIRAGLERDYTQGFLGMVYANLGGGSSRFYGYVPAGLCDSGAPKNATIQSLSNQSGVRLLVGNSVCSDAGTFAWLGQSMMPNGTVLLGAN